MFSLALSMLSFAALGAAQSSTVSLFIFADPQSLVASIAGSDSTATSYVVNCASPAASSTAGAASASATSLDNVGGADGGNGCGFTDAITVVQGPSTVHYAISIGDAGSESINCQLMGSTQAICTLAASGSALLAGSNSIPALTTATLSGTDYSFMPVVITAGSATAQKTGSSSISATGSATAKTTASAGTGSTSGTRTGSTTSGATTGSSSSAKTQSTNAAMQGTPIIGAGVLGALGVAVAGAIL